MGRGMKGQATYEFVVAAVILMTIIIFAIGTLMSNFNTFRSDFQQVKLQTKVMQLSDMLVHDNKTGIATDKPGWPVLSMVRINALSVSCSGPANYLKLLDKYELPQYNLNITITDSAGTAIMNCGGRIPQAAVTAQVERIGVLDTTKKLVKIKIQAW